MPVRVTSFYLPAAPSLAFILEDIYLRGSYRCLATAADRDAIMPAARKAGMLAYVAADDTVYKLDVDKVTWLTTSIGKAGGSGGSGGSGGKRYDVEFTASAPITPAATLDFQIDLESASAMIIKLELDQADIKLETFSKSDRTDLNPYTFTSNLSMYADDGLSSSNNVMSRTRKFSFWATSDGLKTHYFRFTNVGLVDATPKLTFTYLTME